MCEGRHLLRISENGHMDHDYVAELVRQLRGSSPSSAYRPASKRAPELKYYSIYSLVSPGWRNWQTHGT